MKSTLSRPTAVIALAGCATGVLAFATHAEEPILSPQAPIPVDITGYVYINARTGERTITPAPKVSRSDFVPRFINEDKASNGNYFWGLETPTLTGNEVVNWGDVEFDARIDAFTFAYATNLTPPDIDPPPQGVVMTMWWCNCDGGFNDPLVVPLWSISVSNLQINAPGNTAWTSWVYAVDLDGTDLVFEIGDTDGSFTGVTGAASTGCDQDDTDGSPLADFSWSYRFDVNGASGSIGPHLALPAYAGDFEDGGFPTGGDGLARGVPDMFDIYQNPSGGTHEVYSGTRFLGGWPVGPYAATFIGLYGSNSRDCGPADFNGDTLVDVLDFLDFIDDFSACENQPAPCGTTGNTDLGGDTIVDILDFLDFIDVFAACE